MTYLTLGETAKTMDSLQPYQKAEPSDTSVEKLLTAIRNGEIKAQMENHPFHSISFHFISFSTSESAISIKVSDCQ